MITFKSSCKEKDNPETTLIWVEDGGETRTELTLVRGILPHLNTGGDG